MKTSKQTISNVLIECRNYPRKLPLVSSISRYGYFDPFAYKLLYANAFIMLANFIVYPLVPRNGILIVS